MKLEHLVLLGLIVGTVAWYSKKHEAAAPSLPNHETLLAEHPSSFRCEGKTHCSQMSSCAEATFYLRNCPGTEIDGDGDGVPCESQFCER